VVVVPHQPTEAMAAVADMEVATATHLALAANPPGGKHTTRETPHSVPIRSHD